MFARPRITFADLNINNLTSYLNLMSKQDKRHRLPPDLDSCLIRATGEKNIPEIKKLLDLANTLAIKETLIDQLYMNAVANQYNKKELDELRDICPIDPSRKVHYMIEHECGASYTYIPEKERYKTSSLLEVCDLCGISKEYKASLAKNLHLHTATEKDALFPEQGVVKKKGNSTMFKAKKHKPCTTDIETKSTPPKKLTSDQVNPFPWNEQLDSLKYHVLPYGIDFDTEKTINTIIEQAVFNRNFDYLAKMLFQLKSMVPLQSLIQFVYLQAICYAYDKEDFHRLLKKFPIDIQHTRINYYANFAHDNTDPSESRKTPPIYSETLKALTKRLGAKELTAEIDKMLPEQKEEYTRCSTDLRSTTLTWDEKLQSLLYTLLSYGAVKFDEKTINTAIEQTLCDKNFDCLDSLKYHVLSYRVDFDTEKNVNTAVEQAVFDRNFDYLHKIFSHYKLNTSLNIEALTQFVYLQAICYAYNKEDFHQLLKEFPIDIHQKIHYYTNLAHDNKAPSEFNHTHMPTYSETLKEFTIRLGAKELTAVIDKMFPEQEQEQGVVKKRRM